MTHYYEIQYQRENKFDGLLSIEDIVNIKEAEHSFQVPMPNSPLL